MTDRTTIEELLRRRIGLDPSAAGPSLIARATRARMNALRIGGTEAEQYNDLVCRSEREFEALVEEVVVPESWFFRDETPFNLLSDRAASGWIDDPFRPPLRALSVPCAGGEEPYSIAIALIDRGLPVSRFHVDAVDVSHAALRSAGRAIYGENAFRSRDLAFRDRHFLLTPAGYALSDEVRVTVEFLHGNLIDPLLLADRPAYDVIFCRNLLIYLTEEARRQAWAVLDRLLLDSGLLILGHAEQIGLRYKGFRPTGDRRCFAYERSREDARPAGVPVKSGPKPKRPLTSGPKKHAGFTVPSPKTIEAETGTDSAAGSITEASRLADLGRYDDAADLCERDIKNNGPSAPALFLLGVVRQAAGEREKAERYFEKVVYLDPLHEEALLALSLLSQRRGDQKAAVGYRRRAERAYQEKHPR